MASFHGDADDVVFYNFGLAGGIMSLNGSGNLHPVAESVGLTNYLLTVPGGGHTNIYTDAGYLVQRDKFFSESLHFMEENVICSPVGTSENSQKNTLAIAPNPASDFVKITLPENDENWEFNIFDPLGRLIFSQKNIRNSLIINDLERFSSLKFGVVSARSETGKQFFAKIIFE
jgi:hypothetical protein